MKYLNGLLGITLFILIQHASYSNAVMKMLHKFREVTQAMSQRRNLIQNAYQQHLHMRRMMPDMPKKNVEGGLKFKDYMERHRPSKVWEKIEDMQKQMGVNFTTKEKKQKLHRQLFREIDEISQLDIREDFGMNATLLAGRRKFGQNASSMSFRRKFFWVPGTPQEIYKAEDDYDPDYTRFRFMELMKQHIYQVRDKMIYMQELRKKYRTHPLFKFGLLFSKADQVCKVWAMVSVRSLRACSSTRKGSMWRHYPYEVVEALDRIFGLMFDRDLIVDIIKDNHAHTLRILSRYKQGRLERLRAAFED